jgi:peptidoglycan/LPS O-acetylase OafA/YrhL
MRRATSLYLDLVRFAAAMTVFLEHFREHTLHNFAPYWVALPFWDRHLGSYSQIAVIVFFVLSGYVIAHVMATRERTVLEYAASRFGRLYSVVLPALILAASSSYFIKLKYWDAYLEFDLLDNTSVALHYLGTALFMGHFWLWPDLEPPDLDPMWSLSFECSYYVAIALIVFASRRTRLLGILLLSMLAGPTVVLMAPTWMVGYAAYHVRHHRQLHPGSAIVIWMVFIFLLLLCPLLRERIRIPLEFLRMPDKHLGELLASYAAAICFATSLLAFDAFSEKAEPIILPFTGLVRWLGSMTFALYLFHQPLLSFLTVYRIVLPSTAPVFALIWMFGGTFLIAATLGRFCEQSKGAYKRCFVSIWKGAARLHRRFARKAESIASR